MEGQKCHSEIIYKDLLFLLFLPMFRATTEGLALGFSSGPSREVTAGEVTLITHHRHRPATTSTCTCHSDREWEDAPPPHKPDGDYFLSAPNLIPLSQEQTEQTQKSLGARPLLWQCDSSDRVRHTGTLRLWGSHPIKSTYTPKFRLVAHSILPDSSALNSSTLPQLRDKPCWAKSEATAVPRPK